MSVIIDRGDTIKLDRKQYFTLLIQFEHNKCQSIKIKFFFKYFP